MPDNSPLACILLATCNGERFLREQVESIQAQTVADWRLLVSDDHSDDGTAELVADLARADPRITVLSAPKEGQRLGVVGNFGRLMQAGLETPADVFFFCDQDDLWQSDKLETLLGEFPEVGREAVPMLAHSDLEVVDDALRRRKSSFVDYMSLNPRPADPLHYLFTRNFVTGCAIAVNRRLLALGSPIPTGVIIHDWWLAQIAAALGQIRYVDRPLVRYRQHSDNAIGSRGIWHGFRLHQQGGFWREGNRNLRATFSQAVALQALMEAQGEAQAGERAELICAYLDLPSLGPLRRLRQAQRLGLRKGDGVYRLVFMLRLVTV